MIVDKQTLILLGSTATLAAGGAAWLWVRYSRDARRLVRRAIRDISHDAMHDIVIPDGVDGTVHVDHLLLTSRGLLVLDVKDVHGSVFASDNMDKWTVMEKGRRFSFANPQTAAMRRLMAGRAIARDVPVHGRIALTPNADFAGSPPSGTTTLDALCAEFDKTRDAAGQRQVDAFYQAWNDLRRAARADRTGGGEPVAA